MALFKILNNFSSNNSIETVGTAHEGYCYFDKTTAKFWIDTSNNPTDRMALNAYKADWSTLISISNRGTNKTYLLGTTAVPTGNTVSAQSALTEQDIYMDTTAGALAATSYKIAEKVKLQYNSTIDALDFVFVS